MREAQATSDAHLLRPCTGYNVSGTKVSAGVRVRADVLNVAPTVGAFTADRTLRVDHYYRIITSNAVWSSRLDLLPPRVDELGVELPDAHSNGGTHPISGS
jgi:hypothetical protein